MEPIVLHLPAALKPLADVLSHAVTFTLAAVEHARSDEPFDYAAVERAVATLGAEVQRSLHQTILAACDRQVPRLLIGGRLHRPVLRREATYYTLAGPVVVTRTRYRPAGIPTLRRSIRSAYAWASSAAGWLPQTCTAMAFLVQLDPSREATQAAHQLGVLPYSRASFERVAHRVGELVMQERERVESALIAAYALPVEATGVVISLDRVAVPMEEPRRRPRGRPAKGAAKRPVVRLWHMAYCATVTIHDASGKGLHTIRYGRMPGGDVDGLVLGLKDDVMTLLGMRPTLQVTLLCDGAVEMWNLLGEALTEAALGRAIARLVDLWHFLEKMGKAARRRFEAPQATAWLTRWRLRLLNKSGAWRELQAEVTAWGLEEPREQKDRPVHDALTFLANQGGAGRLEYAMRERPAGPWAAAPSRRPARVSSMCVSSARAHAGRTPVVKRSYGYAHCISAIGGWLHSNSRWRRSGGMSAVSHEHDGSHTLPPRRLLFTQIRRLMWACARSLAASRRLLRRRRRDPSLVRTS